MMMTDLLERPADAEGAAATGPRGRGERLPGLWPGPDQWFLSAALVGAGAIHIAMTPSHLGESTVEGLGFLSAAWLQIFLAVAVLLRPSRRVMAAVAGSSVVLIALWVVSRTAGMPYGAHAGHPESVSFVDGTCVALEAVAVVLALGFGAALARLKAVALVGAFGAIALAAGAVASPSASDHASASHGDHGHETAATEATGAAGHDHGASAGSGADDLGFSELSNGHQHERGTEPLSREETVALAGQLATTAELVAKYPTIADAEAAGWRRAGPFSPGLGTHYMGPGFGLNGDGNMDREDLLAPMLVFDGLGPDAKLAGFMYMAYGQSTEPSGFAGPNDHWHYHEKVCLVFGPNGEIDTPYGADLPGVTEEMCTNVGGSFISFTGYMVHVWNVPGYESPDGMFTELNPKITCPDGTYHRIPLEELGDKDTVCLSA
jgi:hypothetical protein